MIDGEFSLALSLGVDCRVRYQLSRHQYYLAHPESDAAAFTKELYSSAKAGTFFFDWLVSPAGAVAEVLRNRFEEVFERENLGIAKNGSVIDNRYGIIFQHAFSRVGGVVTEETIATEYDEQRSKTRYLVGKTLEAMQRGGVLYIVAAATRAQLSDLAEAIAGIGGKDFHIVCVTGGEQRLGFVERGDLFSTYVMNKKIDKPAAAQWQGDDTEWAALLEQVPVRW